MYTYIYIYYIYTHYFLPFKALYVTLEGRINLGNRRLKSTENYPVVSEIYLVAPTKNIPYIGLYCIEVGLFFMIGYSFKPGISHSFTFLVIGLTYF